MRAIVRNAIQCKNCGDIIESKHVHDYVECSCGQCSVDGGLEYLRRSFRYSPDDYVELSEYADVPGYHIECKTRYLGEIYETDSVKPIDVLKRMYADSQVRITSEDGQVVYDTLTKGGK